MKLILINLLLPLMTFAQAEIALNWKAEPQFGGFYQAEIDTRAALKMKEGGSGTPTVQMLAYGKVDYAVVSAEEILISNEKNPKSQIVAVFAVFQTNPQVWITKKDRGMKSIGDILTSPGIVAAQQGLTYVEFLKKKYPRNKVSWVPYTGGIGGLQHEKNYTQQGFLTSEPLTAEKAGIQVSSFLIADEGFNPYTTVLAVRKADLEKKKEEIQRIVNTVKVGWQNYLKNPSKANEYMGKINRAMDAETFKKSAEAQKPLIETKNLGAENLGSMTEARWKTLIDTLVELKTLKKSLSAKDQFVNL